MIHELGSQWYVGAILEPLAVGVGIGCVPLGGVILWAGFRSPDVGPLVGTIMASAVFLLSAVMFVAAYRLRKRAR